MTILGLGALPAALTPVTLCVMGGVFPKPDGDVLGPSQVLFCYEQFDELTLLHLREFDKKKLISVETDIVVDHYKEEKFEDGSPGWFSPSLWAQVRVVAWECRGGWVAGADTGCCRASSVLHCGL